MKTFFLTLVLLFQNFIITLYANSYFTYDIFDFFTLYFLLAFIQTFALKNFFLVVLQSFYTLQLLFSTYFGQTIQSYDIVLFFTHINETFESFFALIQKFVFPIFLSFIVLVLLLKFSRYTKSLRYLWLTLLLGIIFIKPNLSNDHAIQFFNTLVNINFTSSSATTLQNNQTKPPLRSIENLNIILILGESTQYKNMQLFGYALETTPNLYDKKQKLFYSTIYAGATNTDVSVPLFLNGAVDPLKIDLSNNLFTLAKYNDFKTTFITTQSNKSMQYIKPYLSNDIDNLKILGSKDDMDLLKELQNTNLTKNNHLIVLQMTGQHSPYIYYDKSFNYFNEDTIINKYNNSLRYTDFIVSSIIDMIDQSNKPTVFIFTSDHGQLLGKNGKFGHNRFEEDVYKVPLLIYTQKTQVTKIQSIRSHNDLYRFIYHYLGYSTTFIPNDRPIRINGTMISGEDGFRILD